MRAATIALAMALALAGVAEARAPDSSLRPEARAASASAAEAAPAPLPAPLPAAPSPEPAPRAAAETVREQLPLRLQVFVNARPKVRPKARAAPRAQVAMGSAAALAPPSAAAVERALRPGERPRGFAGLFQRRVAQPAQPARGSVCGNTAIRGQAIAPVPGRIAGCGIPEPVRITEVAGVKLSTAATIDCPTAQALNTWVERGAKPAVGRRGGGVAGLRVAAHYACRTRNNQRGARISEHGRGRAIDISAILLADGSEITVLRGWRNRTYGPILKEMHRAACGPFGTVLGPNSDRFHQDHFHFDTARYRSGAYCR